MRCFAVIPAILSLAVCELKFVSVVYRHGDRAPSFVYPRDPHPLSVWPNGIGKLTDLGKNQSYELGKFIRKRYRDFLPEKYNKEAVYVISSQYDRTIRSARLVLDGIYEFGHPTVHVLPLVLDNYLYNNVSCPKYRKLMNDMFLSESEKINWFLDVLKNMSEYTGVNLTDNVLANVLYIGNIHDCLLIEEKYGLELPEWTKKFYPQPLREISEWGYGMYSYTRPMMRLRCGPLLKDIIQNFENVINGTSTLKMWQYSAHDLTVLDLLKCLEVFDGELVPSSSAVFLELHETIGENHEVMVTYKKGDQVIELPMPNCTLRCPFERFKELKKDLLPDDWNAECSSCSLTMNYLLIVFCILLNCK